MSEKCFLCEKELEVTFLDKVIGTSVKVGSGEKSKKVWVCNACQKENKEKLKEKISSK